MNSSDALRLVLELAESAKADASEEPEAAQEHETALQLVHDSLAAAPAITTREAALVVALNELIGAATWAYDDASDAGETHGKGLHGERGVEFDSCKALREARDKALATIATLYPAKEESAS